MQNESFLHVEKGLLPKQWIADSISFISVIGCGNFDPKSVNVSSHKYTTVMLSTFVHMQINLYMTFEASPEYEEQPGINISKEYHQQFTTTPTASLIYIYFYADGLVQIKLSITKLQNKVQGANFPVSWVYTFPTGPGLQPMDLAGKHHLQLFIVNL